LCALPPTLPASHLSRRPRNGGSFGARSYFSLESSRPLALLSLLSFFPPVPVEASGFSVFRCAGDQGRQGPWPRGSRGQGQYERVNAARGRSQRSTCWSVPVSRLVNFSPMNIRDVYCRTRRMYRSPNVYFPFASMRNSPTNTCSSNAPSLALLFSHLNVVGFRHLKKVHSGIRIQLSVLFYYLFPRDIKIRVILSKLRRRENSSKAVERWILEIVRTGVIHNFSFLIEAIVREYRIRDGAPLDSSIIFLLPNCDGTVTSQAADSSLSHTRRIFRCGSTWRRATGVRTGFGAVWQAPPAAHLFFFWPRSMAPDLISIFPVLPAVSLSRS